MLDQIAPYSFLVSLVIFILKWSKHPQGIFWDGTPNYFNIVQWFCASHVLFTTVIFPSLLSRHCEWHTSCYEQEGLGWVTVRNIFTVWKDICGMLWHHCLLPLRECGIEYWALATVLSIPKWVHWLHCALLSTKIISLPCVLECIYFYILLYAPVLTLYVGLHMI